jgi:hypothetical protein
VATWVDLDRLSPSVLRHLAAAKERSSRPHLLNLIGDTDRGLCCGCDGVHGHGNSISDGPPDPLHIFLRNSCEDDPAPRGANANLSEGHAILVLDRRDQAVGEVEHLVTPDLSSEEAHAPISYE